ncbi:MAG: hypothetical protein DWQ08_12495 [Proteobacteria bacterium]|nr:MAG: hypothetical protein DWQ08_12495 [Pseudomonadota bacterium]
MTTNSELTNREVDGDLESWRLRNLLTPVNLVAMVVFADTATTDCVRPTVTVNESLIKSADQTWWVAPVRATALVPVAVYD